MKTKLAELVCTSCGGNRFRFPKSTDENIICEDCGKSVASLGELQDTIVNGKHLDETRHERLKRHAKEVAASHEQLRASVAETDRLIIASNDMIRRHRKEDKDADD